MLNTSMTISQYCSKCKTIRSFYVWRCLTCAEEYSHHKGCKGLITWEGFNRVEVCPGCDGDNQLPCSCMCEGCEPDEGNEETDSIYSPFEAETQALRYHQLTRSWKNAEKE